MTRFTCSIEELKSKVSDALEIDPTRGVYRGRRDAFTDPDIFELEMKYIFEGNWIYLAHESQLPNNGDYLTIYMGRQPVVLTRDKNGELHALINACTPPWRHAVPAQEGQPHHLHLPVPRLDVQQLRQAAQGQGPARAPATPSSSRRRARTTSPRSPRFESYRGFLFGSLNPDVPPLEEHLGDTTKIIDMIVDQSPEGLEVLRGSSTYTYDGNWKVQAENGADGYHVTAAALELRRDHGPPQHRRVGHRDQGHGRRPVGQAPRRLLRLGKGPRPALERMGQPRGPAAVGPARGVRQGVRRGQRRLDAEVLAEPVPVPECLHHGPVRLADPALPPDRGGPDRGHHLLHRPEGRERRGPNGAHPPVRGLLQRQRHGHPGRPRGVPLLPEDLPGHRRAVERHEPRRRALDRGPGRGRQGARPRPGVDRGQAPRTRACTSSSTATGRRRCRRGSRSRRRRGRRAGQASPARQRPPIRQRSRSGDPWLSH